MKPRGCAPAASVLMILALAAPVVADTVITTSNQTFEGKITEDTPQHVIIETASGTVTVPRVAIAVIEKSAAASVPKIVPEKIAPTDAPKAWEKAKAAITKGDWVKGGSLLAGLLELPTASFPHANRLAATAALATCYLQMKDHKGAANAFTRRANLVLVEGDKRRLLATAEALENADTMMGIMIDSKPIQTYDEAINAAMTWKAKQLLAEAKERGAKATDLNNFKKLEAAGERALAKLAEADLYSPGFGATYRKEVLATLADNIMKAAHMAVIECTAKREVLSRYWRTSVASVKVALVYNTHCERYLGRREAAVHGLNNLKDWAPKVGVPELYTERAKAMTPLFNQLDELQYHLKMPGMPQKLRIALRRFGA